MCKEMGNTSLDE